MRSQTAKRADRDCEQSGRIVEAIAEAVVAAHGRLASRERPDAVQFLYVFLDYVRLGLLNWPHLLLSGEEGSAAISTADGVLRAESKHAVIGYGSDAQIRIQIVGAPSDDQQRSLCTLLDRVERLARELTPQSKATVWHTLAHGLHLAAQIGPTTIGLSATTESADPAAVKKIAKAAHSYFVELLGEAELEELGLLFRYWPGPDKKPAYLPDELSATGAANLNSAAVETAFRTGFMQVAGSPNDRKELIVPCHFGGVPWIAVCRRLPTTDDKAFQAYTTYRDRIPRLNDRIRVAGWTSLFKEMRKLFRDALAAVGSDFDRVADAVNAAWAPLTRVYPIPAHRLMQVEGSHHQDGARPIPFGGRFWSVELSTAPNGCFPPPLSDRFTTSTSWGQLGERELDREFLMPERERLVGDEARRRLDLAGAVYAIGHPLKHRLGKLRGAFETVLQSAKNGRNSSERRAIDTFASAFDTRLVAVTNTAKCVDLMAEQCRCDGNPGVFDRAKDFLVEQPYPLLKRLQATIAELQPDLNVVISDEGLLGRAYVRPTIGRSPACRLFDPFFDDLLYELVTNAETKVPADNRSLTISLRDLAPELGSVQEVPSWSLELLNPTREVEFSRRLNLVPGEWRRWDISPSGPQGGLRLVAVALRSTECGDVWARPERGEENHWGFRIAIRLPIAFEPVKEPNL